MSFFEIANYFKDQYGWIQVWFFIILVILFLLYPIAASFFGKENFLIAMLSLIMTIFVWRLMHIQNLIRKDSSFSKYFPNPEYQMIPYYNTAYFNFDTLSKRFFSYSYNTLLFILKILLSLIGLSISLNLFVCVAKIHLQFKKTFPQTKDAYRCLSAWQQVFKNIYTIVFLIIPMIIYQLFIFIGAAIAAVFWIVFNILDFFMIVEACEKLKGVFKIPSFSPKGKSLTISYFIINLFIVPFILSMTESRIKGASVQEDDVKKQERFFKNLGYQNLPIGIPIFIYLIYFCVSNVKETVTNSDEQDNPLMNALSELFEEINKFIKNTPYLGQMFNSLLEKNT